MSLSFFKKLFGDTDLKEQECCDDKCKSQTEVQDFEADDDDLQEKSSSGADISVPLASLEEFVMYVVKNLVDYPDQVTYETVEKNRMNIIRIHCAKSDIGKIIGKSGKTISALRTLLQNAAGRSGHRVTVDVLD